MPGTVSEGPSVSMSFANNFWGKDDAGVDPLLQRMHNAKQTCDELKSFYNARASIEEDYARKLLSLSRKPLGSQESGTLRTSLDVLRGEVEGMGKSHQTIAGQMKTELEEPLAAFAGAMKERRKIVQGGVEKLLKVKVQQTQQVNKTRDKYEQECLKIKGYLAQGHMVMGQEERKNKAKLEKTQINLATSNTEYENAVKVLEDTTGRWNRDWKAAADKFQDLEEERLDFTKSSLWTFANIASTVCVSDDAACEKVRLSLENCEVEKDIMNFIKDRGTGQEIPDPPKYINFCRGDVSDSQSETSEDDNYSVAQFQRTINPAYRSSSPAPSTLESHHAPHSAVTREVVNDMGTPPSRETTLTPQKAVADRSRQPQLDYQQQPSKLAYEQQQPKHAYEQQPKLSYEQQRPNQLSYEKQQSSKPTYEQQQPKVAYEQQRPNQLSYEHQKPSRLSYEQQQPKIAYEQQQPNQLAYEQKPAKLSYEQQQPKPSYEQQQPNQLSYEQKPAKLSYEQQQPKIAYEQQRKLSYEQSRPNQLSYEQQKPSKLSYEKNQHGPLASVPHDPYPMDGMTMLCRTGPPSERSSAHSPMRPSSRDSQSEYSNPTSFSSQEPPSGKTSPVKQVASSPIKQAAPSPIKQVAPPPEKQVLKKKSGFFQGHSPFRRKSTKEKENPVSTMTPSNRNTWSSRSGTTTQNTPSRRPQLFGNDSHQNMLTDRPSGSPEPVDPRASFQLNVGNNVFDVATPDRKSKAIQNKAAPPEEEALDPIAQALAELNEVTKASSSRVSADKYHGIATPALGTTPKSRPGGTQMANGALIAGMRGTPPPSYDQPVQRLGLPQPAFTSKAMQQTRQKYVDQTQNMFSAQGRPDSQAGGYGSGSQSRPGTRGSDMPRAMSPAPPRSVSPRPNMQVDTRQQPRSASPNPYGGSQRSRTQSSSPQKRGSDQGYYRHNSPGDVGRSVSPAPFRDQERPSSSHVNSDMAVQLAPVGDDGYGSQSGRGSSRAGSRASGRPASTYYGNQQVVIPRQRSKSVAEARQYNREGRPILHFARALYMYQAAIPEELSFAKGDVLAVLRLQDDGWWEAEVAGKNGRPGLVPSNYLQNC